MRRRLRSVIPALAVLAVLMGSASTAGAETLDFTSDQYLGAIIPSLPAGQQFETAYINELISAPLNLSFEYSIPPHGAVQITRSGNDPGAGSYPTAVYETGTGAGVTTGTGSYTYLLAKYGTNAYVWYIAGLAEWAVPGTAVGGGLSHISYFTARDPGIVPEPASLLLFGTGLTVAAFLSRRRARRQATAA